MGWFDRPEFGPNVGLIEEIYRQYLDDPSSVSEAWREFFSEHEPEEPEEPGAPEPEAQAPEDRQREARERPAERPRPAEPDRRDAVRPAARDTARAAEADGAAAEDGNGAVVLRGPAATIVRAMEASRDVPTATSFRVVPARLLEVNRDVLNGHLRRRRGGKVSFTHLIGYAVVKAIQVVPAMSSIYLERDGKPYLRRPQHINLGLAVDVKRPDGSRTLLVPNVKAADTLDFAAFVRAYEELIGRVRSNKLTVEDFAGTTVTITNPGTVGTVMSVPRLMAGQAAIVGVGAIGYPAEYQGADPETLIELGIGKTMTLTSTYDHRVIQGAESGEFLAKVHRLLLGEDGFYDAVFRSMGVPYVAVHWHSDRRAGHDSLDLAERQARVYQLINMYRVRGHLIANLDPLETKSPTMHPELDPTTYGLTIWDLERPFLTGGIAAERELSLREILRILRNAYCRTASFEYMHISQPDEKSWIQERVEVAPANLPEEDQRQILHKLIEAEVFERFLHNKYVGQKRFSLEGAESLIPILDAALDRSADAGMDSVVIGMAHRGRLNVLASTVGKSYSEIFHEFEGHLDPALSQGSGDVKYLLGNSGKHTARSGNEIRVEVASNPSHLEAVNPVVEGLVRAKQDLLDRGEEAPVLPVLIHGDAAFAGQGVVAETLNLSQLRGYRTGGTVHIVVNNQLGFTTSPDYGRSSTYATDVAKMIQAPIFHVNGDDPEACLRIARLAFDYRQAFKKDAERALEDFRRRLQQAFDDTKEETAKVSPVELARPASMAADPAVETAVERQRLDQIATALATVPEGFNVHPKLTKWLRERGEALRRNEIDWSLGETLAFGSLLQEGRTVRLSGQDSRRGTFSQRHSVLVDQSNGSLYTPLANLSADHGRFFVHDSLLSEFAVMGFEYGYSVADPDALVMWEAQFGDFVNGAQVVVDQFIAAAEDKWGSGAAWCCCCRTASRARDRSTRAPASSASCSSAPRTTCRWRCRRRRPSTSTCCAARH